MVVHSFSLDESFWMNVHTWLKVFLDVPWWHCSWPNARSWKNVFSVDECVLVGWMCSLWMKVFLDVPWWYCFWMKCIFMNECAFMKECVLFRWMYFFWMNVFRDAPLRHCFGTKCIFMDECVLFGWMCSVWMNVFFLDEEVHSCVNVQVSFGDVRYSSSLKRA